MDYLYIFVWPLCLIVIYVLALYLSHYGYFGDKSSAKKLKLKETISKFSWKGFYKYCIFIIVISLVMFFVAFPSAFR